MKFKLALNFLLLFFVCHAIQAQSFKQISGLATDIAISPKDGSTYIIGTSKNVFKYDARTKKFKPLGKKTNKNVEVGVGADGKVYTINTLNHLCMLTSQKSWKQYGPTKCTSLAIDKNNFPWVAVGSAKSLQQYYLGGTWKRMPSLPIKDIMKVAPYSDDLCYVIKSNRTIQKFSNGTWIKMPGKATDIAIDLKTKDVYIIGTSKRIFKWNKQSKKWVPLAGTRKDFAKIAVHNGKIWATAKNKKIYFYDSGKSISLLNSSAPQTQTMNSTGSSPFTKSNSKPEKKDYSGTYRFTLTRILTYAPEQDMIKKAIDIYGTAGIHVSAQTKSGKSKLSPIDGQRNRMIDWPKNNAQKFPSKYWKAPRTVKFKKDGKMVSYKYYGEHEVGKIREFRIAGEAANGSLTFDLQTSFAQKLLVGNLEFGWERILVNIDDVEFGKENFLHIRGGSYPGTHLFIGYKITK